MIKKRKKFDIHRSEVRFAKMFSVSWGQNGVNRASLRSMEDYWSTNVETQRDYIKKV